jgi:glycosyltransferase involved in cell wall biosynthesis
MYNPTISVITVCYNSEKFIERTVKSVLQLKSVIHDLEYIIIDGNSKDGTLAKLEKYKDAIDIIVSEPDKGIYDAMNKGVSKAKGNWVCFMNSGDCFYKPHDLKGLTDILNSNENKKVVYGNWVIDFGDKQVKRVASPIERLEVSMPFNHQASFARTAELRLHQFDLQYKIVADFNFFYHIYRAQGRSAFLHTDLTIAICDATDSTSFNNMFDIDIEHHKITSDNKNLHWRIDGVKIAIKRILGKITGDRNVRLNPFWKLKEFKEQ